MYAIINDGGRQYQVREGQQLEIDYRDGVSKGDQIKFERVLAVSKDNGLQFGKPLLEGASVTAEVVGISQGPKLFIQKFRRRKTYRRRTGHRQLYTQVRISGISL